MSRVESICGLHPDLSVDEYHADVLTPEVSLSSSGIRTLLSETPAHFAARNPRLTKWPDRIEDSSSEMDLGNVVHALILGKGAAYEVIDPSDFTNKDGSSATTFNNAAAKRAKQEAEAAGRIVITKTVYRDALLISDSAVAHLTARFGNWPIGLSEVAMTWQRHSRSGPIFCRALMDHFSESAATIIDIKTTAKSIGDEDLRRKVANEGGDIQAAWYTEGVATLFPHLAGLVRFLFLYVEVTPPYEPRPILLSENWMTRARFRIDRAADIFAKCLRANEWPGWPRELVKLSAPSYLEAKWEAEELEATV